MATAKRVQQDDRIETVTRPSTVHYYYVGVRDGVEISRDSSGSGVTSTFISQKRTPQPDRIVLEMSVEEAETLRVILGSIGGLIGRRAHADDIRVALDDAGVRRLTNTGAQGSVFFPDFLILPVSPNAGTQTSPAKDAAGSEEWKAYKTYGLGNR